MKMMKRINRYAVFLFLMMLAVMSCEIDLTLKQQDLPADISVETGKIPAAVCCRSGRVLRQVGIVDAVRNFMSRPVYCLSKTLSMHRVIATRMASASVLSWPSPEQEQTTSCVSAAMNCMITSLP